jgi:hypothetical protein
MSKGFFDAYLQRGEERRSDYRMALLIDAAIHEATAEGRSPARVLAGLGVPLEVAVRVLTRLDERRYPAPPPVKRTLD